MLPACFKDTDFLTEEKKKRFKSTTTTAVSDICKQLRATELKTGRPGLS